MEKVIKVQISEKLEYTLKFPNVGQLLEIEALKMAYTNNSYSVLAQSGLKSNIYALDTADCFATFQVMIPTLAKDLGVNSFTQLDSFEAKKVIRAYTKQVQPWMTELLTDLYKMEDDAVKEQED